MRIPRDFRPPPDNTANESNEDTDDSDNNDTNDNAIKSQIDQVKQTKTSIQRNVNKDKTNVQCTKLPNY